MVTVNLSKVDQKKFWTEFSCNGFRARETDVDQCTTTVTNFSPCELVYSEYKKEKEIIEKRKRKRNFLIFGPKVDAEHAE